MTTTGTLTPTTLTGTSVSALTALAAIIPQQPRSVGDRAPLETHAHGVTTGAVFSIGNALPRSGS